MESGCEHVKGDLCGGEVKGKVIFVDKLALLECPSLAGLILNE